MTRAGWTEEWLQARQAKTARPSGAKPKRLPVARLAKPPPTGKPVNSLSFVLRWPPSVNNSTTVQRGRKVLSERAREYRETEVNCIQRTVCGLRVPGLVSVTITAYPPDRRKRDSDNLAKCPLDVLTRAGVIEDDSMIDRLTIQRGPVREGGMLEIEVVAVGKVM